jgi:hypothetical protein
MDLLKLLFGHRDDPSGLNSDPTYYEPFTIQFENGHTAVAVRSPIHGDRAKVAEALDLGELNTACFISGGAGGMSPQEMERTRPLIEDGLARFAEEYAVAIIDGGTDSGVMKMVGDVRQARGYHFPLIGIAPIGAVQFPGYTNEKGYPINSGHSHFVFTDGAEFGSESEMIARLPHAIAGGGQVFGIIINGGEIVRQETYDRAMSPDVAVPLLVMAGSGRFSDILARSLRGEPTEDDKVRGILQKSDVRLIAVEYGPGPLYAELKRFLRAIP